MRDRSLRPLSDERGFTLVTVLAVMAVVVLFSAGAFAAANGDLPGSGDDIARKQALAAAEAGVADYVFHLNEDSAFWTKCTAAGPALNDPWTGTTPPATTRWRNVPAQSTRYAIELLPARNSGYSACNPDADKVVDSMIDPVSRSLRVRVTGEAPSANGTVRRSVIANLRRTNFLEYLYFTDYETTDPKAWAVYSSGLATQSPQGDLMSWTASNCGTYYRPAPTGAPADGYNRAGRTWSGKIDITQNGVFEWYEQVTVPCTMQDIRFAGDDEVLGPMHTNDEYVMCDEFTAGRNANDRIESGRSWRPCNNPDDQPNMQGTFVPDAPTLKLPPTDAELEAVAKPEYTFTGKTEITLGTNTFTVRNNGTTQTKTYPSNGVIFVKNGSCGWDYNILNPYGQTGTAWNAASTVPAGCGAAWVKGTYNKDLTIASRDDIVVNGDVKRLDGTDARLGLIADNYIRVWHPVNRPSVGSTSCSEPAAPDRINGRRIDAAILSLQHSFLVDNYYCGGGVGTLTVNGVIAQKFRGPVATTGGTGFDKDYNYDQRLAHKGPPHFLDPVQSAWKVRSFTEQQGPH